MSNYWPYITHAHAREREREREREEVRVYSCFGKWEMSLYCSFLQTVVAASCFLIHCPSKVSLGPAIQHGKKKRVYLELQ